jgi:hypothetical protein
MISVRKEKEIRSMLDSHPDMSDNSIAEKLGVTRWPVKRLRSTRRLIGELQMTIGWSEILRVRNLLMTGLPIEAVVVAMKMPRDHVKAIRRWFFLIKRKPGEEGPCNCPCCGSILYGDEDCYEPELPSRPLESDQYKRLVLEMIDLEALHLVRHPLFYYLVQRARKVIDDEA